MRSYYNITVILKIFYCLKGKFLDDSEITSHKSLVKTEETSLKKKESPLKPISENRVRIFNIFNFKIQVLITDTPRTNERRSRFAALSAQVEEFECDLKPDRTLTRKENLLKGPARRVSVGIEVFFFF